MAIFLIQLTSYTLRTDNTFPASLLGLASLGLAF